MSTTTLPPPQTGQAETAERGSDTELRAAAVASLKRRRKLAEEAVAYVTVNGVLWLIWALGDRSTDGGLPWPAWVTLIWGFVLVIDAWRTLARWPRSLHEPLTDEAVDREVDRLRRR
jgi:2TM domain